MSRRQTLLQGEATRILIDNPITCFSGRFSIYVASALGSSNECWDPLRERSVALPTRLLPAAGKGKSRSHGRPSRAFLVHRRLYSALFRAVLSKDQASCEAEAGIPISLQ